MWGLLVPNIDGKLWLFFIWGCCNLWDLKIKNIIIPECSLIHSEHKTQGSDSVEFLIFFFVLP